MKNQYIYTLSGYAPVSLNSAYLPVGRGRYFPRPHVTEFKEAFLENNKDVKVPEFYVLAVSYIFLLPESEMYYKNGRLKKRDISNYIKVIEDVLMDVIKNDDSYILSLSGHKRISPDDRFHCVCVLRECSLDEPLIFNDNAISFDIVDSELVYDFLRV